MATSKLSDSDMRAIIKRVKLGESLRKIAEDFPVSHQAISKRLARNLLYVSARPRKKPKTKNVLGGKVATNWQPSGIPTTPDIKIDTLRNVFLQLTGSLHRGTKQECIDETIAFLQRL